MEGIEFNRLFAIQFVVQLGIFLMCFLVLKKLVFDPFLKLIHLREQKTHGLKEAADHDVERASKLKTDYETFMKSEYKKTHAWLEEERKKITDEEHGITQAARDEVGQKLQGVRKQISEDVEKARVELSPLVADFASRIASKLVGKPVNISGGDGMLKKNLNSRPTVQG